MQEDQTVNELLLSGNQGFFLAKANQEGRKGKVDLFQKKVNRVVFGDEDSL